MYDCGYCVNLDFILHTVFQYANATSIFENGIIKNNRTKQTLCSYYVHRMPDKPLHDEQLKIIDRLKELEVMTPLRFRIVAKN